MSLSFLPPLPPSNSPPPLPPSHFLPLSPSPPSFPPSSPAAQFLHDNGVLLHYNDHLRGLNNLYFIDPIWLADLLAEVVTVPQRQNFVHNGILKESNVAFIFRDSRRFPSKYFPQYLQLLERFEIALSLGNNQRLIPSMLPMERPAINFTDPLSRESPRPSSAESTQLKQRSDVRATLTGRKHTKDGLKVMSEPTNCIRRRYRMAYTPSGFWSRLISRLIINLKRSGLMDEQTSNQSNPPTIYWRRGIVIIHGNGRFIVESIQTLASTCESFRTTCIYCIKNPQIYILAHFSSPLPFLSPSPSLLLPLPLPPSPPPSLMKLL